jgi:hypothetical protein
MVFRSEVFPDPGIFLDKLSQPQTPVHTWKKLGVKSILNFLDNIGIPEIGNIATFLARLGRFRLTANESGQKQPEASEDLSFSLSLA